MSAFLVNLLSTTGYALPELLGCSVALVLVWTGTPPGRPRGLAVGGLGMMLACVLLQLGIGLYQVWMIDKLAGDSVSSLKGMFMAVGVLRLFLNCVFVSGIVLLAWALRLAIPVRRESRRP